MGSPLWWPSCRRPIIDMAGTAAERFVSNICAVFVVATSGANLTLGTRPFLRHARERGCNPIPLFGTARVACLGAQLLHVQVRPRCQMKGLGGRMSSAKAVLIN